MRIDWLSGPKIKRLADEEARYAILDHGDRAEEVLTVKLAQTRSEDRRQVYRMALKALRKLR